MATWKLTKKLKETHLSSAFSRGGSSHASSEPHASQQASRSNTIVAKHKTKPGSQQAQTADNQVYDDLQTPRGTVSNGSAVVTGGASGSSSHLAGATAGASANVSPGLNANTQATLPGTDAPSSPHALLRVKIYDIKGLELPRSIKDQLPPWAFETGTTRPPPLHIVMDYDKTQIILHAIAGTIENPVWDKPSAFDVSPKSSPLSIQVYARVPQRPKDPKTEPLLALTIKKKGKPAGPAVKDILISSTKLPTSKGFAESVPLSGNSGRLKIKLELEETRKRQLTMDDFTLLKVVGKGSFGKVMQVRKKDTDQIYALKIIRKAHIVSRSEVGHTLAERTVLAKINNPFIVPLKFSFQSPEKLYLVLAFVNGGELFHHLQREGRFDLNRSRFYTAELLCALECLHEYNVIYRDLKPENILLDYTGHIALCDFGLCKLNMNGQEKTSTFCGTPEYLAPEVLLGQGYTKVVDWWTLGVLFYEMLTGLPPFYDQDTNAMYHKILQDPLTFPSDMDREARSLLLGLLDRDPKKRLGVNGAQEIKAHPFFRQIDWKCLLNKKYAAPFQPSVASATDTSNFDQEFTNELPVDSVVDKNSMLSESVQKQFGGWSYVNDSKLSSSGKW